MQSAALLISEIITFVVCDEIHHCSVRECGRLIKDEAPILDAGSERAHALTVRIYGVVGNPARHAFLCTAAFCSASMNPSRSAGPSVAARCTRAMSRVSYA